MKVLKILSSTVLSYITTGKKIQSQAHNTYLHVHINPRSVYAHASLQTRTYRQNYIQTNVPIYRYTDKNLLHVKQNLYQNKA